MGEECLVYFVLAGYALLHAYRIRLIFLTLGINRRQFSKKTIFNFVISLFFYEFFTFWSILFTDFFCNRLLDPGKILTASEKLFLGVHTPVYFGNKFPLFHNTCKSMRENVPLFSLKHQGSAYATCYVLLKDKSRVDKIIV